MGEWQLRASDLKKYPHFDPLISITDALQLATDPVQVAQHSFYPFIRYIQHWTRFSKKGELGEPKKRPIRYAARRDAYIYSYYRHILSERYEAELNRLGLGESVVAYRRLVDAASGGGKCNIHFAYDAVMKIRQLRDCCVIALDISGFFESLDHDQLKALWCRMLGVTSLPPDHFRVFEAITEYAVVDKQSVYKTFGHFGEKRRSKAGKAINGYLTPFRSMPKQLCSGKQFRAAVNAIGANKLKIEKNFKSRGIPQGSPISDLLANIYLLDFDYSVLNWIRPLGGAYYRYSDDILIVVPGGEAQGADLLTRVRDRIGDFGDHLKLSEKKSSVFVYRQNGSAQEFRLVLGTQGRNGLEYLGFRYDGRRVFIRDATLSNLQRKVTRAARRDANEAARRYPDKGLSYLQAHFDYERLIRRFGRVEDFGERQDDYRNWTFWTYAQRAAKVFGPIGVSITRQLQSHRKQIRHRADRELDRAIAQREKRKLT